MDPYDAGDLPEEFSHFSTHNGFIAVTAYVVLLSFACVSLAAHAYWSISARRKHYGPMLSAQLAVMADYTPLDQGSKRCMSCLWKMVPIRQRCLLCGNAPLGFQFVLSVFAAVRLMAQAMWIYGNNLQVAASLSIVALWLNIEWLLLLMIYWHSIQLQQKAKWHRIMWCLYWGISAVVCLLLNVLGHKELFKNGTQAAKYAGEILIVLLAFGFFLATLRLRKKAEGTTKNDMKLILALNLTTCLLFGTRAVIILVDPPMRYKWWFVSVIYWIPDLSTGIWYTLLLWHPYMLHEEILAKTIGKEFEASIVSWVKTNTYHGCSAERDEVTTENQIDTLEAPLLLYSSGRHIRDRRIKERCDEYRKGTIRRLDDFAVRVKFCNEMFHLLYKTSNASFPVLRRLDVKLQELRQAEEQEGRMESINCSGTNLELRCPSWNKDEISREDLVKLPEHRAMASVFLGIRLGAINISGYIRKIRRIRYEKSGHRAEVLGPSIRNRQSSLSPGDDEDFRNNVIATFKRAEEIQNQDVNKIKSEYLKEWCSLPVAAKGYLCIINPSLLLWVIRVRNLIPNLSHYLAASTVPDKQAKWIAELASLFNLSTLIKEQHHRRVRFGTLRICDPPTFYAEMLTPTAAVIMSEYPPPSLYMLVGETEVLSESPRVEVRKKGHDGRCYTYNVISIVDFPFKKCTPVPTLAAIQLRKLADMTGLTREIPLGYWCVNIHEEKDSQNITFEEVCNKRSNSGRSSAEITSKSPMMDWRSFAELFEWASSTSSFYLHYEEGLSRVITSQLCTAGNADSSGRVCANHYIVPVLDDVLTIGRCDLVECNVFNGVFRGVRRKPQGGSFEIPRTDFGRFMVSAFCSPLKLPFNHRSISMGFSMTLQPSLKSQIEVSVVDHVRETPSSAVVPRAILPWLVAHRVEALLSLGSTAEQFISASLPKIDANISDSIRKLTSFGRVITFLQYYEEIVQDLKCFKDLQGKLLDAVHGIYRCWVLFYIQKQTNSEDDEDEYNQWENLHKMRRHSNSVKRAVANQSALTFKPSTVKTKRQFRYMPTNLQAHMFTATACVDSIKRTAVSTIMTCGAPAVHDEDLRGYSVKYRIRRYRQALDDLQEQQNKKMPKLRTRKRRKLEEEHQHNLALADSVICQALASALSAFVSSLEDAFHSLFSTGYTHEAKMRVRTKICQWFDCGYPVFWECLLSSIREEKEMLEDMEVGVQSLSFFGFRLVYAERSNSTSTDSGNDELQSDKAQASIDWEGIEFYPFQFNHSYSVGIFQIPIRDASGVLASDEHTSRFISDCRADDQPHKVAMMVPLMFGYGINEWQPLAEFVYPGVYEKINEHSADLIQRYVTLVESRWFDALAFAAHRRTFQNELFQRSEDAYFVLDWLVGEEPCSLGMESQLAPVEELGCPDTTFVRDLVERIRKVQQEHREKLRRSKNQVNVVKAMKRMDQEATDPESMLGDADNMIAEPLLQLFEDIAQKLNGGRLISCKSGKDRTAMSVTLEHARNAMKTLFPSPSDVSESEKKNMALSMANLLRAEGTRVHVAHKNTRVDKDLKETQGMNCFAINSIQNRWFPPSYKCPRSVLQTTGKQIT